MPSRAPNSKPCTAPGPFWAACALLVLAAGCTPPQLYRPPRSEPVPVGTGKSSEPGFRVTCTEEQECQAEAERLCGAGYEVLSSSKSATEGGAPFSLSENPQPPPGERPPRPVTNPIPRVELVVKCYPKRVE